jgi:HAD superfamily hydrolase (TIGR01509 family)
MPPVHNLSAESPSAVLFDIDGTLVDSNYLHIEAWSRAFIDLGFEASSWRIHRAIGMDSNKLLYTLLGDTAETVGVEIKRRHSEHYRQLSGRLRAFDKSQELMRAIASRAVKVVLATSAPQEELIALRKTLDVDDVVAAVTSSDDVETAKPAPDLIRVALAKSGVANDRAIFVGDSVWDMQSAEGAGVDCLGVLSGGYGRSELVDAGAKDVYDDVADLLMNLDASLLSRLWN